MYTVGKVDKTAEPLQRTTDQYKTLYYNLTSLVEVLLSFVSRDEPPRTPFRFQARQQCLAPSMATRLSVDRRFLH